MPKRNPAADYITTMFLGYVIAKVEQVEPDGGDDGGDCPLGWYVLMTKNGAYWLVGRFADKAAAGAWGEQEHGTPDHWQVVFTTGTPDRVTPEEYALELLDLLIED